MTGHRMALALVLTGALAIGGPCYAQDAQRGGQQGDDAKPEQADVERGWTGKMRVWRERGEGFLGAAHRRGHDPADR